MYIYIHDILRTTKRGYLLTKTIDDAFQPKASSG